MLKADNSENYKRMTETPVSSLIPRLAIPTIISMLVSSIYNMADTFFVSQLGTSASGAVGIVFSIMAIIQAVGFTIGMGSGILVSKALGARDHEEAEKLVSSAFFSSIAFGLILAFIGLVFNSQIMSMLGATETILPYAEAYSRYIFIACPIMIGSFVMNNILRSEGKALYAMIGITVGGLLNIALDPLFIFTFGLGTAGAAIATAISQAISFILLLSAFLRGKSDAVMRISKVSLSISTYGQIVKTGLPSLARQGLASIATILLNVNAAVYGDAAIAAMSISGRITFFIFSVLLGFGQGFQPVSAFNWGAKRYDRVYKATSFTAFVGTIGITILSALCFIAAPSLIGAFRDDPDVIRIGVVALRAQALLLPLTGINVTTNMSLQSTSHVAGATFLALCRQGIFFIPFIIILPQIIGILGVEIAQPVADFFTFLCSLVFFIKYRKELRTKMEAQRE